MQNSEVENAREGHSKSWRLGSLGMALVLTATAAIPAVAAGPQVVHNTPKFVASAKKIGPEDPTKVIDVSIWLNPHNKPDLDAVVKGLYTPGSPSYRQFLTKSEFAARYAPTAAEAKTVQDFFTANRLKIVNVGPNNFYVRARGSVAAVSSAFKVSLDNYSVKGEMVRANSQDPEVSAAVAPLVGAIYGLDTNKYTHPLVSRGSIRTPAGSSAPPLSSSAKASATGATPASAFNPTCFTGTRTESFVSGSGYPTASATYTGNGYTGASSGCGYTPANIQAAYNLTPLYKAGLDGTGQTIVILDWCGSPTIKQDANAFSKEFGLPAVNLTIINTPTPSNCAAPDPEINIDVEWAHAIAPGAAIDLVVPPSATFQDVDEGFFYAVNYQLGSVISGSYGSEELYTPETILITEDLISETAAVLGISANFSSGDSGDFTFDFPQYDPPSVSAPADSPDATAVGGVSLVLNPNNTIKWQTGWGTNVNVLSEEGYIADPPSQTGGFNFGSGGGPSGVFLKPSYQSALPGATRQLPDVSWLADPYTGAYIAISEPFTTPELTYQVYGGTSLACPMFSALWAIANQAAGQPLGQAAPYLYNLPAYAIIDIGAVGSSTNVKGKVTDATGTTSYSAAALAAPLEGVTTFYSALWDYPLYQDTTFLLTFGTDSGLTVGKGWDNVTGVGVPNGTKFVDAFKP